MPVGEREKVLRAFADGKLQMLCACDILNEGWDCPDVEVLLMARPTLSKIIYMRQLGRGTRKAIGKESLIVFDFVDNARQCNQRWSLHRLARTRAYRPGHLVPAPEERIADEQTDGTLPPTILNLGIWAENFEEIDIFDWQSISKEMLPVADLELALAASAGYLRNKIQKGELTADHTLEIGTRRYFFSARTARPRLPGSSAWSP